MGRGEHPHEGLSSTRFEQLQIQTDRWTSASTQRCRQNANTEAINPRGVSWKDFYKSSFAKHQMAARLLLRKFLFCMDVLSEKSNSSWFNLIVKQNTVLADPASSEGRPTAALTTGKAKATTISRHLSSSSSSPSSSSHQAPIHPPPRGRKQVADDRKHARGEEFPKKRCAVIHGSKKYWESVSAIT